MPLAMPLRPVVSPSYAARSVVTSLPIDLRTATTAPTAHETDADWSSRAACTADPDALFVTGAEQNRAKMLCQGCPVRLECLADALDNQVEFGVWGGMTERERRALLRRRPDVKSWGRLFSDARRNGVAV